MHHTLYGKRGDMGFQWGRGVEVCGLGC